MLRPRSRIQHIFATSHMAIRLIATCTVTHGAHAPHGGQHRLAILRGGGSSPPRLPRTQNPEWLRYRSTINGLKEGEPERQDTETWATACRHLAGVCDLALLEGGTCELLAMHGDSLIKVGGAYFLISTPDGRLQNSGVSRIGFRASKTLHNRESAQKRARRSRQSVLTMRVRDMCSLRLKWWRSSGAIPSCHSPREDQR
jgi:hypothetical protein